MFTYLINQQITQNGINLFYYCFFGLGEMLGFTWDEIEQAYFAKNKINHVRQETGY
jgi:dimeric dUTPase (all-alpha-NTP-PPase superfamily)